MKDKPYASIIFLVYNGLKNDFNETLGAVLNQKTKHSYEIIVIDSGSTDGTIELIKKYKQIRLYQIPNSQFGHGKTRQMGARLAKGEIVIYLVQDAIPCNDRWLDNMVLNFKDNEVVGVCGRIVPKNNASLLTKINVYKDLIARKEKIIAQIKNKDLIEKNSFFEKRANYYFFHDISSAIKRDFIMNNPFPDIFFAEDIEFAKKALSLNKKIIFEPKAKIYHSHEYSLLSTYHRNLLDSRYFKIYFNKQNVSSFKEIIKNTLFLFKNDLFAMKCYRVSFFKKLTSILYSPIIHFTEQLGQYRGAINKEHGTKFRE